MIEQLSNAISFFAFFVASKVGKTALTVTVDVWEVTKTGTATEIVTAGSATEVGDGLYTYLLASGSVDAEGEYVAVFKTTDATVDAQHIPAVWAIQRAGVENLDAAMSTRSTLAAGAAMTLTAAYDAAKTAAAAGAQMTLADGAITAAKIATNAIDADALSDDAVDAILDEVVEGALTMRQMLRLFTAALAGKATGGGTATIAFRDVADAKTRLTLTVDANGNRTAVVLDGTV